MKKNHLTLIPFLFAALCFILYKANGSYVAADGILVESFFYIPLGYLCLGIGIISLLIQTLLRSLDHYKKTSA